MRFVRYCLQVLSGMLFHASLLLAVSLVCFSFVLSDRREVKSILIESNVYEKIVPALIESSAEKAPENSLPLDDPDIVDITNNVFSERVLQEKTEAVIDDAYDWLEGRDKALQIKVDVSQERTEYIDQVSMYAVTRLNMLPTCSTLQTGQLNVFTATCRPQGNFQSDLLNIMRSDLSNGDFLAKTVYTEADLPKTSDGTLVHERYSFIPSIFQFISNGILIGSILVLVTAGLYVISRSTIRRGIQALGRDLATNGIFFIASVYFFVYILPEHVNGFTMQSDGLSMLMNDFNEIISKRFAAIAINVELVLVSIGITLIVLERMSRPSSLYGGLRAKSGLASSTTETRHRKTGGKTPPLQTSEGVSTRKLAKKKKSKYRKLGV